MKRLLASVLPLLLLQGACTVTAVSAQGDARPNNSCTGDGDCSSGHCSGGLCQTLNGQLEALLIAATPPSDSGLPHLTFVTNVEDVPTSGGSKDLTLPGPGQVTGSLVLPKGVTCYPGFVSSDPKRPILQAFDRSLPVTVTLSRRERLLGLSQQISYASANALNAQGGYTFDIQVPAGDYDVYLVPPTSQESCKVPPQLYRAFPIADTNSQIQFPMSAISSLTLDVHWLKGATTLDGWVADIIEPGGNPISTEAVLGDPTDPGDKSPTLDYGLKLWFSTVEPALPPTMDDPGDLDLLRLRPPAGVVAPTVLLYRSAFGLLAKKTADVSAELQAFTHYPAAVEVEGQLRRKDDGTPVGGNVTLVSKNIAGMESGVFATYQTTIEVNGKDDKGVFRVTLPPGSYLARTVPTMAAGLPPVTGALAAIEEPWVIPADIPVQAGKVIELPVIAELTGQARVAGAQVQAVASPASVLSVDQAFEQAAPFTPRAASALVDETGHFVVQTDPGTFNVTVQASESLGFGWFVRPGLAVGQQDRDLGHVALSTPSVLTGVARVSLAGGAVTLGSASVRAYAYLDEHLAYTRDPKLAKSVIEVAETRADENGAYRLLVPSSLAASK